MAKRNPRQPTPEPLLRILADLPIEDPADGLAFHFGGIARTLAEVAWNPVNRTPLTVVIRAEWGRGKTTLMHQIDRCFRTEGAEGRRRVGSLWLNVWQYPGEEKVLAGLLGKLIDKLRSGDLLDQLKIRVDEHKERFARAILATAAPWLFVREQEGGRYDAVFERRAFYDTFRQLFAELLYLSRHVGGLRDTAGLGVDDRLRADEETHVLAVFLDDLDRCSDERVVEVLEAIYLFQGIPTVCFYLGLDWGRLREILRARMPEREERFLEKVVQLAYEIPDLSREDAGDYIADLVRRSGLAEWLGEEGGRRLEPLAGSLATLHPRHLKRFLNELAMSLAVLRNLGKLTATAGDGPPEAVPAEAVLALHALRWIAPDDRRSLRNPQALGDFLGRFAALEPEDRPEAVSPRAVDLYREQRWIFDALGALAPRQCSTLLNYSSREVAEEVRASRTPHGEATPLTVPDLRDLDEGGWVEIDGGTFVMGARDLKEASPEHAVTLRPYRIAKYPVTNGQYAEYVAATGAKPPEHWPEGKVPHELANHPVVYLSWQDAKAFCEWLTREIRERGRSEGSADLPSEAQWERAAGGTKKRTYPWGEEEPTDDLANFGSRGGSTTPVTRYPQGATPEGVFDLAGNAWEWCRDWFGPYSQEAQDEPIGAEKGRHRVVRGGAFPGAPGLLRVAYRHNVLPEYRSHRSGLRVVWSGSGGQA